MFNRKQPSRRLQSIVFKINFYPSGKAKLGSFIVDGGCNDLEKRSVLIVQGAMHMCIANGPLLSTVRSNAPSV